jgi:hypothetical protein
MYNPWSDYRVTGTWEAHRSYSYGGTDWPLGYGTALRAPATGTLTDYGWVGTAGRRAGLVFDQPVKRVIPASKTPMYGSSTPYYEHNCDMVTFIYQHASRYNANGRYAEGAIIGYSGASASGKEWGGDAHLHGHGLCIHGARVDFMKFIGAAPASTSTTPVAQEEDEDMTKYTRIQAPTRGIALIAPGYYRHLANDEEVLETAGYVKEHKSGNDRQFDIWVSMSIAGTSAASAADLDVQARVIKLASQSQISPSVAADAAAIATAVDAALADNFAAIPDAVNDDAANRLQG